MDAVAEEEQGETSQTPSVRISRGEVRLAWPGLLVRLSRYEARELLDQLEPVVKKLERDENAKMGLLT